MPVVIGEESMAFFGLQFHHACNALQTLHPATAFDVLNKPLTTGCSV